MKSSFVAKDGLANDSLAKYGVGSKNVILKR